MKILLWACVIVLLVSTGCSKDEISRTYGVPVNLSGNITTTLPVQPDTRTGMSGSTASFVNSDKIGVFETLTNRNNVLFTYNGTAWNTITPMYWYNGTATHTFYAYYPYNSTSQNNLITIPLLSGQNFGTTPDASCDMLLAGPKTQARSAGTNVPLTFSHAFSLLQFNITAPLVNTYTLKTMTIQGGNTTGSSNPHGLVNKINAVSLIGYNIKTGKLQSDDNDNSVFAQSITKDIPSVGLIGLVPVTIYAIILPGTYTAPSPAIQFVLNPLIGSPLTTKLASLPNTQFSAGTKYVYSVQVGGTVLGSYTAVSRETDSNIELTCLLTEQFNNE